MGKVIGIMVVVAGLWVGLELYQNGTEGAFGGIFGSGGSQTEARPSTSQRAGSAVEGAHTEADERRERMLGN